MMKLNVWWKRKSNTELFTRHIISLKDHDHTFGENETSMQNLIFSFGRYWTFHLTAASFKAIGYSDAIRKVMQKIGSFNSVRGFQVSYVPTEVKLAIALICTALQSLCIHFSTELFITSPSSGTGQDAV